MNTLLWIGFGGALGSITRALCSSMFISFTPGSFPYATLLVNVVGCCIIGIVHGRNSQELLPTTTFAFLTTGFCGGFTTFSAFSIEVLQLLRDGQITIAALYSALSVGAGIFATLAGFWIAKQLH